MIPVVDIRDLHVRFHGARDVYAVNGVDITLEAGEVLGLLGESGLGKSVTLRALLRMLPPPQQCCRLDSHRRRGCVGDG
jgi:peptide/nickel transport system ATP-binding protein